MREPRPLQPGVWLAARSSFLRYVPVQRPSVSCSNQGRTAGRSPNQARTYRTAPTGTIPSPCIPGIPPPSDLSYFTALNGSSTSAGQSSANGAGGAKHAAEVLQDTGAGRNTVTSGAPGRLVAAGARCSVGEHRGNPGRIYRLRKTVQGVLLDRGEPVLSHTSLLHRFGQLCSFQRGCSRSS